MRILKLDATSSTNDFLKELSARQSLAHLFTVATEHQTAGRGQMGAKWESEAGKNLMFSVLLRDIVAGPHQLPLLNMAISVAVYNIVSEFVPEATIKWPNDIMAGNKKIAGILIENVFKTGGEIVSIAGIGLNVNQENFEHLPGASSMKKLSGNNFDRDELLKRIVSEIGSYVAGISDEDRLRREYQQVLFRFGLKSRFYDSGGKPFVGEIAGVATDGKLIVNTTGGARSFGLKEISMDY